MQAREPGHDIATVLDTVVSADGEVPVFAVGQQVRVLDRKPTGHYRVPHYIRGKRATVEAIIPRPELDNEQEGFGRNAGSKRHYYRIAALMTEIWPTYLGSSRDELRIEVFETWLERV